MDALNATSASEAARPMPERLRALLPQDWRSLASGYASAISGSLGRLVFSLAYFVVLANTLTIAEFGIFATCSAAGVMLSRLFGLGFSSPLYRAATVKPQLIGVYSAGFALAALASLPLLAGAAALVHAVFFASQVTIATFAMIIAAEAVLWRSTELAIIVNNGMGRFARAAVLVVIGTALRAAAAVAFMFWHSRTLAEWSWFYLGANALALLIAAVVFYPRYRWRLRPALYRRRVTDSLATAGAEMLFYLQMELDKLLVLSLGGAHLAGIYAIIMRLVDLTAIPIRTFNMMLIQAIMRAPSLLRGVGRRVGFEVGIFAVSCAGLLALALILSIWPTLLGGNVAQAAPIVMLALLVPGLRNLTEYHAELLYARGQTVLRAINLTILGACKAMLLSWLLVASTQPDILVFWLNGVFAMLYAASAALTYSALHRPSRAF